MSTEFERLTRSLPDWARALDPVIVTSPVTRSGTTLLQRLLSSAPNAIVYGELVAGDLEIFVNLYVAKAQQYRAHEPRLQVALEAVLNGEVDAWILDLMPDVPEYLSALGAAAFAGLAACREHALSVGRPVWGVKYPQWRAASLRLLRLLLPQARMVVIHRDLLDCARSAKREGLFTDLPGLAEYGRAWAQNLGYALDVAGEGGVLLVDYAELVESPAAVIERVGGFTGARGIDPAVMSRRVNTFPDPARSGPEGERYAPPAELTEEEVELVNAQRAVLADRLTAAIGGPR